MNTRFAVATHILAYLAHAQGQQVSSEVLACSAGTHPVVVRRLMSALREAGFVQSQRGAGGGTVLARPATEITLLDVFRAVQETDPDIFQLSSTNPNTHCDVGGVMQETLESLFGPALEAMRVALAAVTVEQVAQELRKRLPGQCPGAAAS
ncbi:MULTISPECIES: Rrf2 family transcriptional regulator [Hymenobacter]